MIKLLRIDDKLLHGQIAFSWVIKEKIHTLMIADDDIINDSFTKMTLGLSKPNGVNLKILSLENTLKYISFADDSKNIMIIVENVKNANFLIKKLKMSYLNIGLLRTNNTLVYKSENISLDKEDYQICKDLINQGVLIDIRLTANDELVYLNDKL